MNKEVLQEISSAQIFAEDSIRINPIEGGFTGAAKYAVEGVDVGGQPVSLFAKVVAISAPSTEMAVLDTEAKMYGALTNLGLAGLYFPSYRGFIKAPAESALLLDYLSDVSWGGPWNYENIEKLSTSIDAVHNVSLTDEDVVSIKEIAGTLTATLEKDSVSNFDNEAKQELFRKAWRADDNSFVNSRGVRYFSTKSGDGITNLLGSAASYDEMHPARLILNDLNFGNLAVAADKVYFVDPVYMNIGNPASDLVVLGVNILRSLSDDANDSHLREIVKSTFFKDKAALAQLITYWVACTSLPMGESQDFWMDFQQSCAVTALTVWEEMANEHRAV